MPIPQVPSPLFSIQFAKTYNAGWFKRTGDSNAQAVQRAITAGVVDNVIIPGICERVLVPSDLIPYDPNQVVFNTNIRMVREGGRFDVYDIKAYGAPINGTDDDRPGFQAALTQGAGHLVYIPEGTAIIDGAQPYVKSNTVVEGAGIGLTIIKRKSGSVSDSSPASTRAVIATGSADGTFYTVGSRGSSITFKNMTVDGNAAGNPGVTSNNPHADGIRADSTDDVLLQNVRVQNCLNSGTYLNGCERTQHINVTAVGNGQLGGAGSRNGLTLTGATDDATNRGVQDEHVFVSCISYGNTDAGIVATRNGRIVVANCIVHDNGDVGVEGDNGSATSDTTNVPAGWIIIGNHLYNNTVGGINLGNANVQRIIVTNNIIEDCAGFAINATFASGSLIDISDNIIRGCGTSSSGAHAMTIGTFDRVIVANNLIEGNASSLSTGIVLLAQTAARHVTVEGNQVISSGGGGISVSGGATGVVANNLVVTTLSTLTDGIAIQAGTGAITDLDVHGNVVLSAVDDGFFIRTNGTSNMQRVRLRNNTSRANGGDGVTFDESGGGLITGLVLDNNDFEGNTGSAITGLTAAMVAHFDTVSSVSADRGDASVTLNPGIDDKTQRFATTLTANRTVTLGTGFKGAEFRVVRTGLGAFTLDVGGLKTIPSATAAFVDVQHDGTAWRLTGFGNL